MKRESMASGRGASTKREALRCRDRVTRSRMAVFARNY